ncbi:MAG: MFS transporter, partial [Oceanospirillaceae bacterium]
FIIGGILLCLAVIPIALGRNTGPVIDDVAPMSIFSLIKKSPLGVACCVVGGLIYAALFNMLPVFAKFNNIVDFQLTLYMGAAILGAFILQFPVGYLSDKFDRRLVIFFLLLASSGIGLAATVAASFQLEWALFLATGVTTGIIACLYPLSISEAFDKLRQNEMVSAMGSMILGFSLGGVLGPYSASIVMEIFGNNSLFYFLAAVQMALALFVLYRMSVSEALPIAKQEHFVMQGAAIAAMVDLDPRTEYIPVVHQLSSEAQSAIEIAQNDQGAAVNMVRAISISQPERAVELACALATVKNIDVLRLYEVMREALPYRIMEITREIVATQPDLAYELVKKLAETHPNQVVSVAAELGHAYPGLRVSMAKIAVESAPNSALQVAEYYAKVVAEEREALRPADEAEDTSEQDMLEIASELWESSPEQALDVAVTMAEAMPDTAVSLATEFAENIVQSDALAQITSSDDVSSENEEADAALNLLQRLTEAVPESAVELAVAVVGSIPDSAGLVASELAGNITDNVDEIETPLVQDNQDVDPEFDQMLQEAYETDAAIELVQILTEAAPENYLDVAAAVAEAVPESAGAIATEVINSWHDESEEILPNSVDSKMDKAHQAAINTDVAIDVVQRLSEAAPENISDVAAAVVDILPDSASIMMDNISEGKESTEGEWVSSIDEGPKSYEEFESAEENQS